MIKNLKNENILRPLQAFALLSSAIIVFIFLEFYISSYAKNFAADFERQQFFSLTKGETYTLAREMAALAKSPAISCVIATKNGVVFFEDKKISCENGLFRKKIKVNEPNNGLEILFVFQLQNELFWGFLGFLLIQASLAFSLIFAQRQSIKNKYQQELELAALAQQVAHDIRSPLAALKIIARESDENEPLDRSIERLQDIIQHLTPEKEHFQTYESIGKIVFAAKNEKEIETNLGQDLEINLKISDELQRVIPAGDPFFWRRILSNILNNAIEATSNKPIKISISAELVEDEIHLAVQDWGKGMSQDFIQRLGPKRITEGKPGGRGIGLYDAISYLKELNGQFSIESVIGKGTKINFVIPTIQKPLVVLLEDDEALARLWWKSAAKEQIPFQYFLKPEDLLKAIHDIPLESDIYLDAEYENSHIKLEEILPHLLQIGFKNIYLSTGHNAANFKHLKGIKSILGKEPPWI